MHTNVSLRNIYKSAIVCDMTLTFYAEYLGREVILKRAHAAGVSFVSLTVAGDFHSSGAMVHNIASVHEIVRKHSDLLVLARNVDDIRKAKEDGKLAVGLHFQGSASLESDPNMVQVAYDLGVRQMLLVYNLMNSAATGCHERVDSGLSRYGLKLVGEMNRVGMIVDCTHTGYRCTMEMMEASTAPVIFSHSNARALFDHERNISDDQIIACAKTGGVIGVVGVGKFMSERGTSEVSDLLPHIRYIADLVGPGHVGLGIDNVYFFEQHYETTMAHQDRWTKGYPPPPWHYFTPEQLPELSDALLLDGFSEAEVRGILGENYLRIAGKVWR
jgi:membrane dipeptidase